MPVNKPPPCLVCVISQWYTCTTDETHDVANGLKGIGENGRNHRICDASNDRRCGCNSIEAGVGFWWLVDLKRVLWKVVVWTHGTSHGSARLREQLHTAIKTYAICGTFSSESVRGEQQDKQGPCRPCTVSRIPLCLLHGAVWAFALVGRCADLTHVCVVICEMYFCFWRLETSVSQRASATTAPQLLW